ncbi:hypothetical protein [Streptomyces azureus]|uniref:Mucin-1 n=1 Tax=Streptomyces azureus TaxID=146537 RepID=A0A0K8PGA6_STRAJ|nr:hypothetical protein [Streptomyces azureus]GAP46912.1 Mucin-1 [Streptomyces azureus]
MQKIPTLFVRNPDDRRRVLPEITPGCEWVLEGQGAATRKYDGTCILLDESGEWWARREVKSGKTSPANYVPVEHDETTGKTVGWEPVEQSSFIKFFTEAREIRADWAHGTYELCGPKINGNPEALDRHTLIRHATAERVDPDFAHRTYDDIANFLHRHQWEGIVYHHPDGAMAKIKLRDFE